MFPFGERIRVVPRDLRPYVVAWVFLFLPDREEVRKALKQKARTFAALVLLACLLCGCQGNPLPEGMDEETLLQNGREVVLLLVSGDYEAVLERMREDVAAGVTAEDIQALVLRETDGAGVYKEIDSTMATGQSSDGEEYGVAVIYCRYSKKNILFRCSFDGNYSLLGLQVRRP